jgi:hypothetical protein
MNYEPSGDAGGASADAAKEADGSSVSQAPHSSLPADDSTLAHPDTLGKAVFCIHAGRPF